ncbi:MAG: EamA family transporter, partial [Bacteriovoracaceae bacterium]|nr:EamA family transporter [Bacteriovoracaceae bacterium]
VLISGLLGMYVYYLGMQYISARSVALSELFFPFCAIIVNWLFLGKTLTLVQLCGGGLLLVGSTLIQLRKY